MVVVGAGPCGAALALLLARAGWAVTLVEQLAPGAARPYRGEGLMPSGVAALEAMGLWPLSARVRHRPLAGWAVVLERQPFFTVAEPLAGDRGCWLVDQASLLAHLRAELEGVPGAQVVEGQAVRGLLGADERRAAGAEREPVRVMGVVLADGRELAADLVVACDGRQSALRRLAGLELWGEGKRLAWLESESSPAGPSAVAGGGQGEAAEPVLWFRLAGAAVAAGGGCVQRRMTVRSNPPGALVYVDDYQIGTTPVSTDFIYYGTRKIRLVKDGYETLTVRQPFPLPWYQIFPLDFVTENLWPWEIRDERVVDLAMTTTASIPPESVVARAEQARLAAGSLPAPPPAPVVQQPLVAQPIPAPPQPLLGPQPLPPPSGGLVLPPPSPSPMQGLQAPRQNAPSQGIPGL